MMEIVSFHKTALLSRLIHLQTWDDVKGMHAEITEGKETILDDRKSAVKYTNEESYIVCKSICELLDAASGCD